ncbi:MAG: acyltransferase family protein [Janthinobacterium lividum]
MTLNPGAFRLILAFLVFVSHVSRFSVGRPAVILFFMLSGYWVSRLYDSRANPSTLVYIRGRFLRVWPLLACVAVAEKLLFDAHGSLASTLGLLGLATRRGDVTGVAWSLDVEMQFYLMLPVAMTVFRRWPRAMAPLLALATLVGLGLLRDNIITVFAYTPAFVAGALIWHLRWTPSTQSATASVAAFGAVLLGLVIVPPLRSLVMNVVYIWWLDPFYLTVCLVLVPFVAWNVNRPSPAFDRHLGNLSFPFYLLQYPVIVATRGIFHLSMLNALLALATTMSLALGIYLFADRPFELWRRRLNGRADDRGRAVAVTRPV